MLPRIVVLTDSDGRVLDTNQPARSLIGSCVGRNVREIFKTGAVPVPIAGPGGDWRATGSAEAHGVVGPIWSTSVGNNRIVVLEPTGVRKPASIRLTPRQIDVLRLVSKGLTDPEIAEHLGLGRATVRTHVEAARRTLGVKTRSQAVARAMEYGLLN